MNLTSPSQVKAWCIEHDFHPNRTLGQNFLIDKNILEAIVDAGLYGVGEGETVIEIGPGLGVMTQELLRRGHDVVAIEKDEVLAEGLAERIGDFPSTLTVIAADALDVIASRDSRPQCQHLISNLPYQAGTRILLELVQRRELKTMTVLLQTEVAERLAAKEGGRERSLAGVWAQLDYDVSIVRKVGANCFWPRPEVGSSVARLVRHERNAALGEDERRVFRRITKQAFAHRRKQLGTIFKKDAEVSRIWDGDGGVPAPQRRPEQLSVEEWITIAKGVTSHDS